MVLGVFLMLILGTLELSLAVLEVNTLSLATRHVARQAITRGTLCDSPMNSWGPQTITVKASQNHEIADAVRPLLVTMSPANVEITVTWLDGANAYDNRVKVLAKAKHQAILPMLTPWFVNDLQAVSTMRIAH